MHDVSISCSIQAGSYVWYSLIAELSALFLIMYLILCQPLHVIFVHLEAFVHLMWWQSGVSSLSTLTNEPLVVHG